MKKFLLAATIVAAAASLTTPALAADVGVSIQIGEPGFYGRLDIGDYPPPVLIYRRPIIIEHLPMGRPPMGRPPIYLRVPPGHAKHWSKHCREYGACDESVYFVQDSWYNREYVPRYQEQHRDRRDGRRNERDDDRRGQQNGRHGNNQGQGHDR